MNAALSRFVSSSIRAYDPGAHPMADRIREIVSEHKMLPLQFQMADCVGIRVDLTICGVLWEDWGEARVSDGRRNYPDHVNRDMALIVGSETYPELRELLPSRPRPAPICSKCDDRSDVGAERCLICQGLGWIPERWNESEYFTVDLSTLVWR